MARLNKKHPDNIQGDFFVDTTCIDCDTCRWLSPKLFHRADDQSIVYHQPQDESERQSAFESIVSCPTQSIGTIVKSDELNQVKQSFPKLIDDNVYYCGYHSKKSFGAASYFIKRHRGNILIDSPRYSPTLSNRLTSLGGVKYHFLTHKDDVADHEKYHKVFGCERILHELEISRSIPHTEFSITGTKVVNLDDDLVIIPVPGHTKGHHVLLYNNKYLFTGDHLAYSERLDQLYGFYKHCWYSWTEQIKSMERLMDYQFEWVLPGHGHRFYTNSKSMRNELQKCINWMKAV